MDSLVALLTHGLSFGIGNFIGQNMGYNKAKDDLIPIINALQAENYKIKDGLQECKTTIMYQQSQIQAIFERQEELSEQTEQLLIIMREIIERIEVPKPLQREYRV